jgi:hypothetical protein
MAKAMQVDGVSARCRVAGSNRAHCIHQGGGLVYRRFCSRCLDWRMTSGLLVTRPEIQTSRPPVVNAIALNISPRLQLAFALGFRLI